MLTKASHRGLALSVTLFTALLSGCSLLGDRLPDVATESAIFYTSQKANGNSPVALEVVLVKEAGLLKELLATPASDWFPQRQQYLRDHPTELTSWYWEVTPGQTLPLDPAPFKGESGLGLLLFANYASKGAHRARIDSYEAVEVRLDEADFTVVSKH